MESILLQVSSTITSVIAAIVTAISTFFLWRVTRVLARETKKMAEATSQPHIVITFEPTKVSINHFNIVISNTGNATAYNITAAIEPSINDRKIPFKSVSVLKPGDSISSFYTDFYQMNGKVFEILIEWTKSFESAEKMRNKYSYDIGSYTDFSTVGDLDPIGTISKSIKKISQDLNSVVNDGRININMYDENDRQLEQRKHNEWIAKMKEQREK
ncbi:hypothetical protein [Providencia sp. wls1921]|uniref:hypothetical protein n=1 Tax=Providencia sp. wls1921 TaxID=2675153 RepID=UPI0012B512D2|nr:hypothetical protein [Providencia sp. wls1921]MTC42089.1 hypothetical protein [Providencia sp. wls1921]